MSDPKKNRRKVQKHENPYFSGSFLSNYFVRADTIAQPSEQALVILTKDLQIVAANDFYYDFFKVTQDVIENKNLFEIGDGIWNIDTLEESINTIIIDNAYFKALHIEKNFPEIGRKQLMISGRKIYLRKEDIDNKETLLLIIDDMTKIMQAASFFIKEDRTQKLDTIDFNKILEELDQEKNKGNK
jgi:hypothetical protein